MAEVDGEGYFNSPYSTPASDGPNDCLSPDDLAILMANDQELLVEWPVFERLIGAEQVRWKAN